MCMVFCFVLHRIDAASNLNARLSDDHDQLGERQSSCQILHFIYDGWFQSIPLFDGLDHGHVQIRPIGTYGKLPTPIRNEAVNSINEKKIRRKATETLSCVFIAWWRAGFP